MGYYDGNFEVAKYLIRKGPKIKVINSCNHWYLQWIAKRNQLRPPIPCPISKKLYYLILVTKAIMLYLILFMIPIVITQTL